MTWKKHWLKTPNEFIEEMATLINSYSNFDILFSSIFSSLKVWVQTKKSFPKNRADNLSTSINSWSSPSKFKVQQYASVLLIYSLTFHLLNNKPFWIYVSLFLVSFLTTMPVHNHFLEALISKIFPNFKDNRILRGLTKMKRFRNHKLLSICQNTST